MALIVATYDFSPNSLSLWKYWDELKEKHPKLQVTVGVVPVFKGHYNYTVNLNPEFKEWYKNHNDWVHVVQQGCYHFPNECLKFYKTQKKLIKSGYRKLRRIMPKDVYLFKAPFDRMNNNTIQVLKELGYSAIIYHNQILYLKPILIETPPFDIIETYTNIEEHKPNNIHLIFEELDTQLENYDSIGEYTNFNDFVRGILK